jgi:hypothetical protein
MSYSIMEVRIEDSKDSMCYFKQRAVEDRGPSPARSAISKTFRFEGSLCRNYILQTLERNFAAAPANMWEAVKETLSEVEYHRVGGRTRSSKHGNSPLLSLVATKSRNLQAL